jgi:predicted component of type VI protein secretion system
MPRSSDEIVGEAKGSILLEKKDFTAELKKFKQANRQPSEAQCVELLLRLLGLASKPEFDEALTEPFAKFIGHLLSYSGQVKDDASSASQVYDLEGWTQASFLYLHSQSLLALYLTLHSVGENDTQGLCKLRVVGNELWVGVNAYRILRGYSDLLSPKEEEAKGVAESISQRVLPWVNQLVCELKKYYEPGLSVCLPCGTQDHAVYLQLYGLGSHILGVRLDNLTGDRALRPHHAHQGIKLSKKARPFLGGALDVTQAADRQQLVTYLVGVIKCRLQYRWQSESDKPRVLDSLYKKADDLPKRQVQVQADWPSQVCQGVGNCVFLNYASGMNYRLHRLVDSSGLLLDWLFDHQLGWVRQSREHALRPPSSFDQYLQLQQAGLKGDEANLPRSQAPLLMQGQTDSTRPQARQRSRQEQQQAYYGDEVKSDKSELEQIKDLLYNHYHKQGIVGLPLAEDANGVPIEVAGFINVKKVYREVQTNEDEKNSDLREIQLSRRKALCDRESEIGLDSLFCWTTFEEKKKRYGPRRVLLWDNAGIGRATLCRYIAHEWTKPDSAWSAQYDWVLWIPLREIQAYSPDFEESQGSDAQVLGRMLVWLHDQWGLGEAASFDSDKMVAQWKNILEQSQGRILWLVDGYDEIAPSLSNQSVKTAPWREVIQRLLSQGQQVDGPTHLLLTSCCPDSELTKTYPVQQEMKTEGFQGRNIEKFVTTYFAKQENAQAVSNSLLAYLHRQAGIWGIAHIPINLALICGVWQSSKRAAMEQVTTLTGLYEVVNDALVSRYQDRLDTSEHSALRWTKESLDAFIGPLAFAATIKHRVELPARFVHRMLLWQHWYTLLAGDLGQQLQNDIQNVKHTIAALLPNGSTEAKEEADESSWAIYLRDEDSLKNVLVGVLLCYQQHQGRAADTVEALFGTVSIAPKAMALLFLLREALRDTTNVLRGELLAVRDNTSTDPLLEAVAACDTRQALQNYHDWLEGCEKQLQALGFFHISGGHYKFLHLTFQEYWAGRYVATQLAGDDAPRMVDWLAANKYRPTLEVMLGFAAGCCQQQSLAQKHFWKTLKRAPRDITGQWHLQVGLRCFMESGRAPNLQEGWRIVKVWKEHVMTILEPNRVDWRKQSWWPIMLSESTLQVTLTNLLCEKRRSGVSSYVTTSINKLLATMGVAASKAVPDLLTLVNTEEWSWEIRLPAVLGIIWQAQGAAAVPDLLKVLKNSSTGKEYTDLKIVAAKALGNLGTAASEATPDLYTLVNKSSTYHKLLSAAIGALKAIWQAQGAMAVFELQKVLNNDSQASKDLKIVAAEALGNMGAAASEAADDLRKILNSQEHERIKIVAAEALGNMGAAASKAVSALCKLFSGKPSDNLKLVAAEALGNMGAAASKAEFTLLDVLKNEGGYNFNHNLKKKVVQALVNIGAASEAVSHLCEELSSRCCYDDSCRSDYDLKAAAIKMLGDLGATASEAVPALRTAIEKGPKNNLQTFATNALEAIWQAQGAVVVDDLRKILNSREHEGIKRAATNALEAIWQAQGAMAVFDLQKVLNDSQASKDLKIVAAEALVAIWQAQGAVDDLWKLLQDSETDNKIKEKAARALGEIGAAASKAVPDLLDIFNSTADPDRNLQTFAVNALEAIWQAQGAAAVNDLWKLLQDSETSDWLKETTILRVLGKIGAAASEVVPDLLKAFHGPTADNSLKRNVANALEAIWQAQGAVVVDDLRKILNSREHEDIKRAAVQALGNMGAAASKAVPDLRTVLQDKNADNYLKREVIEALGNMGGTASEVVPDLLVLPGLLNSRSTGDWDIVATPALVAIWQAQRAAAIPDLLHVLHVLHDPMIVNALKSSAAAILETVPPHDLLRYYQAQYDEIGYKKGSILLEAIKTICFKQQLPLIFQPSATGWTMTVFDARRLPETIEFGASKKDCLKTLVDTLQEKSRAWSLADLVTDYDYSDRNRSSAVDTPFSFFSNWNNNEEAVESLDQQQTAPRHSSRH